MIAYYKPFSRRSNRMPRLDDSFINSVVYIYPSEQAARDGEKVGGTGFLIGVPLTEKPVPAWIYAVTNLHIITNMPHPVIRYNTKDGKIGTYPTEQGEWVQHPDGDDVAIHHIKLSTTNLKYSYIGLPELITKDFIDEWKVGEGDDVYMVGRFIHREGKDKNIPTVRKGIISSMDTEPFWNQEIGHEQESFLIETHSISGYSGSPVIVIIEPYHVRPNTGQFLSDMWYAKLLGVDWGHLIFKESVRNEFDEPIPEKLHVTSNSAIACVVPAWKIKEILDLPEQVEMRKKMTRDFLKKKSESAVQTDKADEEKENKSGLTKEEFEDALRKIARPLKKDDQEKKGT